MSASNLDPHEKKRSREVGRVARGEQSTGPHHGTDTGGGEAEKTKEKVTETNRNRPPDQRFPVTDQTRHCFDRYVQYHKCLEMKGRDANDCNNLAYYVRSLCPQHLVAKWDEEREHGTLPASV